MVMTNPHYPFIISLYTLRGGIQNYPHSPNINMLFVIFINDFHCARIQIRHKNGYWTINGIKPYYFILLQNHLRMYLTYVLMWTNMHLMLHRTKKKQSDNNRILPSLHVCLEQLPIVIIPMKQVPCCFHKWCMMIIRRVFPIHHLHHLHHLHRRHPLQQSTYLFNGYIM